MRLLRLLCVLCVLLACLHAVSAQCGANIVVFNSSAPCSSTQTGCDFLDVLTWANGVLPAPTDTVVITGSSSATLSTINLNNNYVSISCMNIQNVILNVHNSTLEISLVYNATYATLQISSGLVTVASASTYNQPGSSFLYSQSAVIAEGGGVFESGYNDNDEFILDQTSTLQTLDSGKINVLDGEVWLTGNIYISSNGNFLSLGQTTLSLQSSTFEGMVDFTYLTIPSYYTYNFTQGLTSVSTVIGPNSTINVFQYASLTGTVVGDGAALNLFNLEPSVVIASGNGTLYIANSNVNITATTPFEGQMILAGQNNLTIDTPTFYPISFSSFNSILPNNNIQVTNLELYSSSSDILVIPGSFFVYGNLVFNGQFNVTGYVYSFGGVINVTTGSSLNVYDSVILQTLNERNSAFGLSGNLTSGFVSVDTKCSFYVLPNQVANLTAEVVIFGNLVVPAGSRLDLFGTLTSSSGSQIVVSHLSSNSPARINVNGSALLMSGTLGYSIEGSPSRGGLYLVLTANNVAGSFNGKDPYDIYQATKGILIFEEDKVYVKYVSKIKHGVQAMPWYGWLLIVIGIVSALGFVYLYYQRRKHLRDRYHQIQ